MHDKEKAPKPGGGRGQETENGGETSYNSPVAIIRQYSPKVKPSLPEGWGAISIDDYVAYMRKRENLDATTQAVLYLMVLDDFDFLIQRGVEAAQSGSPLLAELYAEAAGTISPYARAFSEAQGGGDD